jgi:hypothetical protein
MTKFTTISRQRRAHTSVSSFCLLLSILSEAIAQTPIPGDSFTYTVQKIEAVSSKIQMRDENCIASVFEEHPPNGPELCWALLDELRTDRCVSLRGKRKEAHQQPTGDLPSDKQHSEEEY